MKNLRKITFNMLYLSYFLFAASQINAQSFYNTFDRAQALGKGIIEVSGNFAHQAFSYDGETEGITNTFGLRAGYGFTDRFDLKFSWTNQRVTEGSSSLSNFFVLKPKYSIGTGKFAIALPFSILTYSFDSESDAFISPEIMFNHLFSHKFELGSNARLVIPFAEGNENLLGIDIALGFSKNLNQWVLRPEFGILFNPGEEGMFLSTGLAFSYFIGTAKVRS